MLKAVSAIACTRAALIALGISRGVASVHSCPRNTSLLVRVWRVFGPWSIVEYHGWRGARRECGPVRHAGVIGIAGSCEMDPRRTHDGRERARIGASSGHIFAAIRVIEDKGDLRAVKRTRPPVQDRRLPGKPIHIGRRTAGEGFGGGLFEGGLAH
jgi:hypothetical protein